MIIRNADLPKENIEGYAGGEGVIEFITLVPEDKLKDEAKLIKALRFQPGAGLGLHAHVDNYEVYYILEGRGIVFDDGQEYEVTIGDVVYTADGASHYIRDAGDGDLFMLACVINENKAQ